MALTVEDGSIVANADSYVSVADAQAFATLRGESAFAALAEADAEVALRKAVDYLETLRAQYKGSKVDATQSLQWPRNYVKVDGFDVANDTIPNELITAQIWLAIEASVADIMPSGDGKEIVSEAVGPISTTYAKPGTGAIQPIYPKVDALLAPLLSRMGALSVTRA